VYGGHVSRLIEELGRLPGIGGKSAQRLAFHILHLPAEKAESLAAAIVEARRGVKYCSVCCNLTDKNADPEAILKRENANFQANYLDNAD
jgi:recombination protein RecR